MRKKALIIFSVSHTELLTLLKLLVQERLTAKQKAILQYLCVSQEELPVTRLVVKLKQELHCSETALWNNLTQLKRMGILKYGDAQTKGLQVKVTERGKLVCKNVLDEKMKAERGAV